MVEAGTPPNQVSFLFLFLYSLLTLTLTGRVCALQTRLPSFQAHPCPVCQVQGEAAMSDASRGC
jgi:hypothetical protein